MHSGPLLSPEYGIHPIPKSTAADKLPPFLGGSLSVEIFPQVFDDRTLHCRDLSGRGGPHTTGIKAETSIGSCHDWFEHCFEQTGESVELPLPETGKERADIVRFEIAKRLLFCQLGDWVLARFPMRVARLVGHAPQVPDEESVYERLFTQILFQELDAIHLDSVRPDTLLWRYLQGNPLVQKSFRFYSQQGPLPHLLIRLNGSFSDYMKRFSPKTRKNRLREIKILREFGDVKLIRVTEASGIDSFLEAAYGISRKTRQFKRFGRSIAARHPRLVKNELLRLARHGSLRSYLLTCSKAPCSFILGQQSGSRFHPVAVGVDPTWEDYSVGTVLLLFVLEDLFKENSPDFYDLGTSAKHKEYLATDSYLEASVWLFRRRPYPALASSIYEMCNLTSRVGGAALERFGLKGKVTHLMRRMDLGTGS
jgi:GNAT acetyltransferase-like protein